MTRRVRDIYPLTAMQQGMLVHALRTPDKPVYQQQFVLAITGVPDETALRQGLDDLVARHTVLRTGFVWDGVDTPVQVVFAEASLSLEVGESDVDSVLARQWAEPFDLRRPPLMRAHALRVGPAEWRLVTTIHHLVLDGWSMPTVQADLAELIAARLEGRPSTLPPAAPFREFVLWLRDQHSTEAANAHFKRLLGDLRHPTPLGIDHVSRASTESGPSGRVERLVPGDPDRQPDVLARRRGLLPSTIAHAAWGLLLARCAGTPDAVFGTTVSGRPAELPGVTERVGMFVNTVPVRISVDSGLAAVQEQLIAGRAFEHTPVAAAQRCSAVPLGEPLYESVLGFQNYFLGSGPKPAGPVTVRALHQQEQTGLPLVVSVAFPPGATWVRVEFDEHRIDRPTAEWLADRYQQLLGELAAEETLPLQDIPLAPWMADPSGWVAAQLRKDEAVSAAAVIGERAWVVAADGRTVDLPALLGRLRRRVPSALLPNEIRQLMELPLTPAGQTDTAALLGPGPAPERTTRQPMADRLAALPAQRRTEFLTNLREAQRPSCTDAERTELLRLADGGTVVDPPATVPDLIAQQDPDTVAVIATDGQLTYREVLDRAAALAAELHARGVGVEDRVAVCLPRTSAMVWAPLGIMLAGAAYVPVDPKYPQARIDAMCADAGVSTMVTPADFESLPDKEFTSYARPEGAAYVIYTSGSTGQPKGVLVEQRAVVDFARHIARAYRIGPDTRLLGFAALTFDVSVFDLWAGLCAGATLVLAGDEERLSVEALRRLMVEQRVTMAELPPSLMPLLDPAELPELRLVSVGGEAPAGVLVDRWATGGREFWNGYGPAETTVAVTLMRCQPPSGGRIPPIGRPMPNHRAYVLDERLRLVPPGVPGELCIAGAGLARGYLGRPGHTADRFVPDPFGTEPGARLYRTGDLARWTPDGVLEFLGRVDRQVKIRGFRVEPGEVEAVLAADERIRQVAVEVWQHHLTAYVVPAATPPALAEVREIAAARLPDYMVPTRLAVLAELPRTSSGKLDRQALPAPPEPAGSTDDASWTELERTIATEVLGPLLKLSTVDRLSDFFELGGNSLQATQVTARVRDKLGVEIGLADFLAEPTVARLATLVEQERQRAAARQEQVYASRPALRMTPHTVLPQSFPQQALFQADERYGHDPRYNAPFAVRMRGRLDLDALRRAFALVLSRHPALRVVLYRDGDDYLQRVQDLRDVPLEVSDVDGVDVRRLVREEGARAFDLGTGPLIRVRVHRLGHDHHVLQWTVHHAVIDGWSVGVMLHEVGTAYHAYAEGTEPELEPIQGDYAEFVQWHRDYVASPRYTEDLAVWRDRLRGLRGIGLPTPVDRQGHEFRPGYHNVVIKPELAAAVRELSKRSGISLYMTTLAAYATVLAAHAGSDEIAVVTPNALRIRSHWERLIGWFVNRVVVRVPVAGAATFAELLKETRAATTAAFGRQAIPFETLRAELELPDAALAACYSVQNAPMPGRAFRSSEFDMELVGEDTGIDFTPIGPVYAPLGLRYETAVQLLPQHDGSLTGGWEYDAGLFDERTAQRWCTGFVKVLTRVAAAPETPVRELMSDIPIG